MIVNGFYREQGCSVHVSPLAGEQKKTLSANGGWLHYLRVCNTTGAKVYVHIFDNDADSGTTLVPPIPVAPNDFVELGGFAIPFTTGCTVASSSTQTSYTAGGANDLQIHSIVKEGGAR